MWLSGQPSFYLKTPKARNVETFEPFAHSSLVFQNFSARSLFAARGGVGWVIPLVLLVFARRRRRKMLEHLVHAFVEVLGVLVRLIRQRIARGAPPQQFLCLRIEEIDHQ